MYNVQNIYIDNNNFLLICKTFFSLSSNDCRIQNRGINYKANFGLAVDLIPDENVISNAVNTETNLLQCLIKANYKINITDWTKLLIVVETLFVLFYNF